MRDMKTITKEDLKGLKIHPSMYSDPTHIDNFIGYVNSFYNYIGGLYPIADGKEIARHCREYVRRCKATGTDFCGDSMDREAVRTMIGR